MFVFVAQPSLLKPLATAPQSVSLANCVEGYTTNHQQVADYSASRHPTSGTCAQN